MNEEQERVRQLYLLLPEEEKKQVVEKGFSAWFFGDLEAREWLYQKNKELKEKFNTTMEIIDP